MIYEGGCNDRFLMKEKKSNLPLILQRVAQRVVFVKFSRVRNRLLFFNRVLFIFHIVLSIYFITTYEQSKFE